MKIFFVVVGAAYPGRITRIVRIRFSDKIVYRLSLGRKTLKDK